LTDRLDQHERPELQHALVEFVATNQYHFRPPQPPIFLFVIDVSVLSAKTGVLAVCIGVGVG
jgi:protein transport protein SEC24